MRSLILIILFTFFIANGEDKFRLTIEPGSKYIRDEFSMHIAPQIAIWIENDKGEKIKDIFVTKYFYIQLKNDMVKQPENLPVWLFRSGYDPHMQDGTLLPTPPVPPTDAVCGATPKKKFTKEFILPNEGSLFTIYVEVNNSFDFNETFKRVLDRKSSAYNIANGQPALIYSVKFGRFDNASKKLQLIGFGSSLGATGKIYTDISVITDAKDILAEIVLEKVK